MKTVTMLLAQLPVVASTVLLGVAVASAQTPGGASSELKTRGEFSGLVGGSGLISFDGGGTGDGMWGLKAGGFANRRFGVEGAFEQSMREPDLRYVGGDFVIQFPKQDWKKPIPFVHVGAGSFLYDAHGEGAVSLGAGIKQYLNEKIGVRFGVQDRMIFRHPEYHRLDFYAGVVFRF